MHTILHFDYKFSMNNVLVNVAFISIFLCFVLANFDIWMQRKNQKLDTLKFMMFNIIFMIECTILT